VGLLGLALSIAPPGATAAQEPGALAGTIVDDVSGQPLPFAAVTLPDLDVRVEVEENGQFLIEGLPIGVQPVKFEAPGYVSVVERLEIAGSDFLQIRLDPVAAVLDQILVIAGRSPRDQSTGDVLVVPASERPWQSALDLLEDQVPGVTVRRGGGLNNGALILIRGVNSFRSDGAPAVFLDGVRIDAPQTGFHSFHTLETISAEIVTRIRVLKGAAAAAGYAMGANGVILIETIRGSERTDPRD
jgi:hypothetical protein